MGAAAQSKKKSTRLVPEEDRVHLNLPNGATLTAEGERMVEWIRRNSTMAAPEHYCTATACGSFRTSRGALIICEYFEQYNSIRLHNYEKSKTSLQRHYYWQCCRCHKADHPSPNCHWTPRI